MARQLHILPFTALVSLTISLVGLLAPLRLDAADGPLSTATAIQAALKDTSSIGKPFEIIGDVIDYARGRSNEWNIIIRTANGDFFLRDMSDAPRTGAKTGPVSYAYLDRVRFFGCIFEGDRPGDEQYLGFLRAERLSAGRTEQIPDISLSEIAELRNLGRLVHVHGLVRAATRDESDPNFIHMMLRQDGISTHIFIHITALTPFEPETYLGADVRASGICKNLNGKGLRRQMGHILSVSGLENVQITKPSATPGNAPDMETLSDLTPSQIVDRGFVRAQGNVLAAWGGNAILLKTTNGRLVRVRFQHPTQPKFGESILVLGLPTTDFYRINLIHARWQSAGSSKMIPDSARAATPSDLLTPYKGKTQLMVEQDGRALKFSGVVRYLSEPNAPERLLLLESDGLLTPIDFSANPQVINNLQIGCVISVSGTCIVNMDNWNTDDQQDVSQRFFLVPRTPEDVVVLSRPSWWTPGRLMTLLGLFVAALLGALGWNVSLNRRARIKGRELADEQMARVTSELKVNERTRLAVELHDALSQTLTGVSMQIDTAAEFAEGKIPMISKCLAIASRTIDACRMELRNTLWDLRSAALDEPSMDAAIRKTLCQNLARVNLSVRFNVPREMFSDNTAHAVLKIIRELATNALRHGKATSLKIAGTIDDGNLIFSVRDNGCGFDPDLAPGISQGHFGLQGIAERLERLNGEMKIESTVGKGARVTVILPIPRSGE